MIGRSYKHSRSNTQSRSDQYVEMFFCKKSFFVRIDPPNQQTQSIKIMKQILSLAMMSCLLISSSLPLLADKTINDIDRQKMQTDAALMLKTDEGCKIMCEEVMKNKKSKKMCMEMMMNDPECSKMMGKMKKY